MSVSRYDDVGDLKPGDLVRITRYGDHRTNFIALVEGPCEHRSGYLAGRYLHGRLGSFEGDPEDLWFEEGDLFTILNERSRVPDAVWVELAKWKLTS